MSGSTGETGQTGSAVQAGATGGTGLSGTTGDSGPSVTSATGLGCGTGQSGPSGPSGIGSPNDTGASGSPCASVGKSPQRSAQEKLWDELYFKRDLDEVHLLIDFISGRPDRSLDKLEVPSVCSNNKYTAAETIGKIAAMRYPPDADPVINAKNAAFLMLAKDRLSAMADPARALSIAYTEMFIAARSRHLRRSRCARLWKRICQSNDEQNAEKGAKKAPRNGAAGANESENAGCGRPGSATTDPRTRLAFETFPTLRPHAERFAVWNVRFVVLCLFWFALTALT